MTGSSINVSANTDDNNVWWHFTQYIERFQKKYNSVLELNHRFEIFRENYYTINRNNMNAYRNFTMGLNLFADLTPTEFKSKYLKSHYTQGQRKCLSYNTISLSDPLSIDWVENGVVNPVRDQGQCGSCWAFATTANAESVWAISMGDLYDLSEQYLVDCATGFGYWNQGCNGGQPDSAFKYMINKGQCVESAYPYTAIDGKCQKENVCHIDVVFNTCYDVAPENQRVLRTAVAKNPVVVAIEADTRYFQFYSSGVLSDSLKCGTNLDHAVEIVGYGTENGVDYWKVRNSWGESWGEKGYVKIERTDSTNDGGVCGIATEPSFIGL
jgi:C1A family cysteine protease